MNQKNAAEFYKFFNNFKRKRNIADYHDEEISESDLMLAKQNTEKIRKFLTLIEKDGMCENIRYI